MVGDKHQDRSVDDSCLICGLHPEGGGHYFEGIENEDGNYEIDGGWLIIPHITRCYVWLCPSCRERCRV